MYFDSWVDFIQMGGHGVYIWSAYALAVLVGIYNLASPVVARRRVMRDIRRTHRITTPTSALKEGNKEGSVEVMNESGS